jgi:hypothetical protein
MKIDPGKIPGPAQSSLYAYHSPEQHLLGGGAPHSTPEEERPHARKYRTITRPTPQRASPPHAGSTAAPGPALPPITSLRDWARLRYTHTPLEFAKIANRHTPATCPSVTDSSGYALITPANVRFFSHGNSQSSLVVQDCLEGIFRLLKLDPSVSLIQQTKINDMLLYGITPTRWKRGRHFLPRASYEDPTLIPTCCGP